MAQLESLNIVTGEIVSYLGSNFSIEKVLDLDTVLIRSLLNGKMTSVPIKEIYPPISEQSKNDKDEDLATISDADWQEAQRRFNIIRPIIENDLEGEAIIEHAKRSGVHFSTVYRWLKKYYEGGERVISLKDEGVRGGKGQSRLNEGLDQIIASAIDKVYLNNRRLPIKKVYLEVCLQCENLKLDPPHLNTVRNRIKDINEEERLKRRYGKSIARDRFEPIKGHFPRADFPLSVVQIDHTKVDIILVDEIERKPVGRPWITMAIDVFSRMVVGLYLSFDPPGALGTGMCLSNAILPKEIYLSKLNISGEWPCWGVMQVIHMDNAKEFRGLMLERACRNYGIEINWRPVKKPHFGGHIERLMGTFASEIHSLPGTTFSNTKERKGYESEKEAVFTIKEFETWLVTLITDVYHNSEHSSIGRSPLEMYREGIFGSGSRPAMGLPSRIFNERKVRLDFMPFVERTIQEYGVIIDHIYYYDDILRRWIHSMEGKNSKSKSKKKFVFRRDPRDISVIYFYDPEIKEYFDIPYRDTSHPPMTLWEFKEVTRRLAGAGSSKINEPLIFEAYKKLKQIEQSAATKTAQKKTHRAKSKKLVSHEKSFKSEFGKSNNSRLANANQNVPTNIKPFEDIDDGTPFS